MSLTFPFAKATNARLFLINELDAIRRASEKDGQETGTWDLDPNGRSASHPGNAAITLELSDLREGLLKDQTIRQTERYTFVFEADGRVKTCAALECAHRERTDISRWDFATGWQTPDKVLPGLRIALTGTTHRLDGFMSIFEERFRDGEMGQAIPESRRPTPTGS